jgi:hypothetical protein
VDALAQLDLGSSSVVLRRARAADVPAIAGLLADDSLGAGRDGVRTAADLQAYQRAFGLIDSVQLTTDKSRGDAHRFYAELGFVASHEGLKLAL